MVYKDKIKYIFKNNNRRLVYSKFHMTSLLQEKEGNVPKRFRLNENLFCGQGIQLM